MPRGYNFVFAQIYSTKRVFAANIKNLIVVMFTRDKKLWNGKILKETYREATYFSKCFDPEKNDRASITPKKFGKTDYQILHSDSKRAEHAVPPEVFQYSATAWFIYL